MKKNSVSKALEDVWKLKEKMYQLSKGKTLAAHWELIHRLAQKNPLYSKQKVVLDRG